MKIHLNYYGPTFPGILPKKNEKLQQKVNLGQNTVILLFKATNLLQPLKFYFNAVVEVGDI